MDPATIMMVLEIVVRRLKKRAREKGRR